MKHKGNVQNILIDTVKKQKWLSSGILIAVLGAIGASLIPPLLLGKIVDSITAGHAVAFSFFVLYFVVVNNVAYAETFCNSSSCVPTVVFPSSIQMI